MRIFYAIYGGLTFFGGAPLLISQMKRLRINKEISNSKKSRILGILWFVWGNAMIFSGLLAIGVFINYNKNILYGFMTLFLLNVIMFVTIQVCNKKLNN